MKIACTKCGELVDVPDMPQPQIMNTPGVSLLVLEHPKPGFCLTCKAQVAVLIKGANLSLLAAPVVTPQKSIIVAPGAALPKNGAR